MTAEQRSSGPVDVGDAGGRPTPRTVSSTDGFPELLTVVRSRLDVALAGWLRPRVATATEISAEVGAAAEAVQDLALRGGKRIRAALVAAGFASYSSDGWSVCEPAMIAIELLQTYLLIHDDWMDHDDVRRGGPAVHVVLRGRLGDALGDAAAVLAGDLASGYAQESLLQTALPQDRVLRASRAFARIQIDVVSGQVAEMTASVSRRPASLETIHTLKTASYTVTGPLLLGATLAGANEAQCAELERFGRLVGIAFQMRDDLLGVFGDEGATGKPVYSDIREGKRTALVVELGGDAVTEALLARVHAGTAVEAEITAIARAMDVSGARARVEARVSALCDEARGVLDTMTLAARGRAWLAGAVSALGDRRA